MNEVIGPLYESVLTTALLDDLGRLDLVAIATAARDSAAAMALGYGPFVNEQVESFAERSRHAQAFLLQIAATAGRAERSRLRDEVLELGAVHCDGCHRAADAHQDLRKAPR